MKLSRGLFVTLLPLLVLGGCSKDDFEENDDDNTPTPPSPQQRCPTIHGGGTTVQFTAACPGCTVADAARAIDGDTATFATITMPPAAPGNVALRATAQDGITYAELSNPGAIISLVSGGQTVVSTGIELRIYLDGAPVGDSGSGGSITVVGGSGSGQPRQVSFQAVAPFDAVEVLMTRSGTSEQVLRVHEFCSDNS